MNSGWVRGWFILKNARKKIATVIANSNWKITKEKRLSGL
jgi:hypothetical protein